MLKTAQIYFLVGLISFQSIGIFLAMPICEITASFKNLIKKTEVKNEFFGVQGFKELVWHNNHEVYIHDQLCDVANVIETDKGVSIFFTKDNFETNMLKFIHKISHRVYKMIQMSIKSMLSNVVEFIFDYILIPLPNSILNQIRHNSFYASALLPCAKEILGPPPRG